MHDYDGPVAYHWFLTMPFPPNASFAGSSSLSPVSESIARKSRFWDRIARKYAADPIADLAGYEATLRRVQGLLSTDQTVLEIGCGTGSTALRLAPLTRRLLATDVSSEMISIAREKLAAQPLPQLSFAVADADARVTDAGEVDVVLAFNLLHLVGDLDQALASVMQTLRPGGRLISKTACLSEMNPLIPWLALPLMRAIGKAPKVLCFGGKGLEAAIARNGFLIESVERHGSKGKDIRVFIVARKPG